MPRDLAYEKILERYNEDRVPHGERPASKEYHKRFIFRIWPRDPKGQTLKETPPGKIAGNGLPLWGATLYDFYYVQRIPKLPNSLTMSTGSKLGSWTKNIAELKHAKHELEAAEKEPDPVIIPPYKAGEWIRDFELRVNRGDYLKFQTPPPNAEEGDLEDVLEQGGPYGRRRRWWSVR